MKKILDILLMAIVTGCTHTGNLSNKESKLDKQNPLVVNEGCKSRGAAAQDIANSEEQYKTGLSFSTGAGGVKDDVRAACWFGLAAEKGNLDAQFMLGAAYEQGKGVEQNDMQAVKYYQAAASKNFAPAQYRLGRMYGAGRGGLPEDLEKMVLWTRRSADQGYVFAEYGMGVFYMSGNGVEKSGLQALSWFSKAVEHGHAYSAYLAGLIYATGEDDVPVDSIEALKWYAIASDGGVPEADAQLGYMYCFGVAVKENPAVAYRFWKRSIDRLDANSEYLPRVTAGIESLKKKLTEDEIAKIDNEIRLKK